MSQQPPSPDDIPITALLQRIAGGEADARTELWTVVYDRLRALAERNMRGERSNHTLQPTALVNEAYLRFAELKHLTWRDRRHFFGVVASVMRRVLVDEARRRDAAKRGGGDEPLPLNTSQVLPQMRNNQLVDLDEALRRLGELNERQAQVVELKFFAGRSIHEIAELLDVSPRTIEGDWSMARTWLQEALRQEP